jgi:transposase-like protein
MSYPNSPIYTENDQGHLALVELFTNPTSELDSLTAESALLVIQRAMQEEVTQRCGEWGRQTCHRHGSEQGYVILRGRKVKVLRPRLRPIDEGPEIPLTSYRAFQQNGRMQRSVTGLLTRNISTRKYAHALETFLSGYGIAKSCVSRHWIDATAQELQALVERPLPLNLWVLFISTHKLRGAEMIIAHGVDAAARRQVVGLQSGSTDDPAAVNELLAQLCSRGFTGKDVLFVLDAGKSLSRAIREKFGDVLIQRCRAAQLRHVLAHLPRQHHRELLQRSRKAWRQQSPQEAHAALFELLNWLQDLNTEAAAAFAEELELTLTMHHVTPDRALRSSLATTRFAGRCFTISHGWTSRVRRWRDPRMLLRWACAALLRAESRFRRLNGHAALTSARRS